MLIILSVQREIDTIGFYVSFQIFLDAIVALDGVPATLNNGNRRTDKGTTICINPCNADLLLRRRVQTHGCTIVNHKVFGDVGNGGVAGDAGGVAVFLVIVAQVQQTARFHYHRTLVGHVSSDSHIVQHQMSAFFYNEERRLLLSAAAAERAAAVNDQRFAAFHGQRISGDDRTIDTEIRNVCIQVIRPIRCLELRLACLTGRLRGGIIRRERSRNESAGDEGSYHGQH